MSDRVRAEVVLEVIDIEKHFFATHALKAVSLTLHRGEVHAIVGENGAGKSTLGKILVGAIGPDRGVVRVRGRQLRFRSPRDALKLGVAGISQELSLVPARTVLDNVMLGSESVRWCTLDDAAQRRRFDELNERFGFGLRADVLVEGLAVAEQQKVELLRALGREASVLVLDEPTARLTTTEAQQLRTVIRSLADRGTTVVFVSHFLDEVLAVADTITIMCDGRIVRTSPAANETHATLLEGMIGRTIGSTFPTKRPPPADALVRLRVQELACRRSFGPVSLEVHAGEVVGIAGLVGAGRSELAHAVVGATRRTSGLVEVDGVALGNGRLRQSLSQGVSLIPESRRTQGLVMGRSVRENVTLPFLRALCRHGRHSVRGERAQVVEVCQRVGVSPAVVDHSVASLSGGNQQKVLFARAMLGRPAVLIADEPTRGVDVGAKHSIYQLISELAAGGAAVLLISSELEEVIGLSHRVLVMRRGLITADLRGDDITESRVLEAAVGACDAVHDQSLECVAR